MINNIYKKNFVAEKIAIKYKGQKITYSEFDKNVVNFANYFNKMGIGKGNKVVLSCINSPDFIYSYFGIVKTGAVVVPINVLLTIDEIKYIVDNSGAKTIVVHPAVLTKAKLPKETFKELLSINVIVLDEEFYNTISSIPKVEFEEYTDQTMISTFLYTSGTTGKPKAAILTHKNLVSNVVQFTKATEFQSDDNIMCVLPMFHVYAFTVCVLMPLYNGGTITILETFQPKEVIHSLAEDDVTIFSGVPAMYIVLLEAVKSNVSLPKLRLAISGAASLPIEVFKRSKEELSFPVIEGYGLTEASPVAIFNPVNGIQKAGSIGIPIPGVECKIVDENGNEVPADTVGELIIKGDNVMLGYYNEPQKTKETLKDGWLYTGDLAKKDSDGYYFIVDRKKDLIIVCGLNVYPREVEEVIFAYPKVKEAAVVGIQDELRGEYVKAFVVLKEDEECTSRELLRYLKQHLAIYKLPREIDFIKELPRNSSGKVVKRILSK